MITEEVNNKISDINFNIEKSLERLAENEVRMGTSSQQYTMMFANELSSMLDNALDQMKNQMKGSGNPKPSGSKPGEQLSDIIKSHEELQKQMQKGGSKGQGESSKPEEGGEKEGKEGKSGEDSEGGEEGDGGKGEKGKNKDGEGGDGKKKGSQQGDEQMSGDVYQIYKQQQDLRNQLENEIERLGLKGNTNELTKSLDRLEQELLMKGFSNDLLQQMDAVKHQLLKLKKAANQQGQDEERQAKTNKKEFNSNSEPWVEKAKEYFNTTEILNRQQLPLQSQYKKLINIYFDGRSN
jgi:hypothetical protein